MKNTVKLFGLITFAALIGFAACASDDSGNSNSGGDITWGAAANGTAGTVTSTKITLTFSAAVTGLTADNITLTNGTGAALRGALGGSGKSWELGITVQTAGTISVKVTKSGVSAAAKNVTVYKAGGGDPAHPISGRTTYINGGDQIVFLNLTGSSGAYKMNTSKKDDNGLSIVDENNKWIWASKAEGSYVWNENAKTVALTAEKAANDNGEMVNKTSALSLFLVWAQKDVDREIEERLAWSAQQEESRAEAEAAILAGHNEADGTSYANLDDYKNALANIRFNEMFDPSLYEYTFSSDGVSLILLEALPASIGTDELGGQAYYGVVEDLFGNLNADTDRVFIFTAAGRTYTESSSSSGNSAGSYSYDSTAKRAYLKPAAKGGKPPVQFYEETVYYEEFDRYPTEADNRASQTYSHFKVTGYAYDSVKKLFPDIIGGGDIEPL